MEHIAGGEEQHMLSRARYVFLMFCVGLVVANAACGNRDSDQHAGPPRVTVMRVPNLDSLGPESPRPAIAVASNGVVAFTGGFDTAGRLITVMDTTGRIVSRFGRRGAGPGELGNTILLEFTPQGVLVVTDAEHARFVLFDTAGSVLHTSAPISPAGFPVFVGEDSADIVVNLGGQNRWRVARVSVRSGEGREILSAQHPAAQALNTLVPPFAARGDRILVANPYKYLFQEFTVDGEPLPSWGRELPPRFIEPPPGSRGDPRPARHFALVRYDDRLRLWALTQPTLEQADVFEGEVYVGHVALPCSALDWTFSKGGGWLLVVCAAPEAMAGIELRLLRIQDDRVGRP
jgi:hypothetical protein